MAKTPTRVGYGNETEGVTLGRGGWVCYQTREMPFPVYLRVGETKSGRLEIVELYIADGRITGEILRRLNLNRIEGLLNRDDASYLHSGLKLAAPDLRRLIGAYTTGCYLPFNPLTGELKWDRSKYNWVELSLLAQYKDSPEPQAPEYKPPSRLRQRVELVVDAALDVPPARPYPENFYREVAEIYKRLAGVVKAPAGVIADANGVPVSTAHQWIKVARNRGFLPKGRQGRAG